MPETMIERVSGLLRAAEENRWRFEVRDRQVVKITSEQGDLPEVVEVLVSAVPDWIEHDDILTEVRSMTVAREIVMAMREPTERMIAISDGKAANWDGYTNAQRYRSLLDSALEE